MVFFSLLCFVKFRVLPCPRACNTVANSSLLFDQYVLYITSTYAYPLQREWKLLCPWKTSTSDEWWHPNNASWQPLVRRTSMSRRNAYQLHINHENDLAMTCVWSIATPVIFAGSRGWLCSVFYATCSSKDCPCSVRVVIMQHGGPTLQWKKGYQPLVLH